MCEKIYMKDEMSQGCSGRTLICKLKGHCSNPSYDRLSKLFWPHMRGSNVSDCIWVALYFLDRICIVHSVHCAMLMLNLCAGNAYFAIHCNQQK